MRPGICTKILGISQVTSAFVWKAAAELLLTKRAANDPKRTLVIVNPYTAIIDEMEQSDGRGRQS